MYDQYIVGFMMIGGFGLGIRCGKFQKWWLKVVNTGILNYTILFESRFLLLNIR